MITEFRLRLLVLLGFCAIGYVVGFAAGWAVG